ncbi:MAG: transposase [Verrucomicrobiota bacterium]
MGGSRSPFCLIPNQVSQSTMGSAVMGVGTICGMISEAMKKELLGGGYVQADETTVPVQSGRTKGKNWQGCRDRCE